MSESGSPSTWLAVLPPDAPAALVDQLEAECSARGWSASASRGEEQLVLALAGPGSPGEIDALVAGRAEVDVLPVMPEAQYGRGRARRRFLSLLGTGLGLLVVFGLAVPVVGFLEPPLSRLEEPSLVYVGPADGLAVGAAQLVRYRGQPVMVVRSAADRWHAVSATCTFLDECRLTWDEARGILICSCHGCSFDSLGTALQPPAYVPLPRLATVRQGDNLYLRSLL